MPRLICHSIRSNKDELYIFKIFLKVVHRISGKQKRLTIDKRRSKIVGYIVFDCHLSPDFSIGDKRQSKTLFLAISICIKQHVFVTCYIFVLIKADSVTFL